MNKITKTLAATLMVLLCNFAYAEIKWCTVATNGGNQGGDCFTTKDGCDRWVAGYGSTSNQYACVAIQK